MRLFLLFIVVPPLHRVKCARLQEDSWHAALFAKRKAFGKSETVTPPGARCVCCQIRQARQRPDRPTAAFPACPSPRSEEHTSELQSLMRISYAVFCLKKKN